MIGILKRNFAMFLLAVLTLTTGTASAATITLGYCNDEILPTDFRTSLNYDCPVMAAVRFSAAQLQALKGGKITTIRIGAEAGMTGTYVWVRPSLTEAAVAIQRLGTTAEGWNEVTLRSPYEITGDEIYVGFNGTLPKGTSIIMNGTTTPNGAFLAQETTWSDLSDQNQGSLLIQAIVEVDGKLNTVDLGVERIDVDNRFVKNGESRTFTVSVSNYGQDTQNVKTLFYQIGTMEAREVAVDKDIEPNSTRKVQFNATVDNQEEGKLMMKAWIESDDDVADNNSHEKELVVYSESYPRTVLLEHFTTLQCSNCPKGLKVLNSVVASHSDEVAWVGHHVGFQEDEFTIQASRDVMNNFGVQTAPLAQFDRTMLSISESSLPSFGIGYENLTLGNRIVGAGLEEALAKPSFVDLDLNADYDGQTGELTLSVSGKKNPKLFDLLYGETRLTVYLTEDNVTASSLQAGGAADEYTHNHVLRRCVTESLGDKIEWSADDTFQATLRTTIKSNASSDESYGWNIENMKAIAFVNRPTDDYSSSEVLNTRVKSLSTSAINGVKENDTVKERRFYNLQGMKVDADEMRHGSVYVMSESTDNGVKNTKIVF